MYARALVGLVALWLAAGAQAQVLGDPTRPPAGQRGSVGGRPAGDPAGLVLESIIISDTNRSAIISGEHVMLGGRIGQARLVKVSEVAVVLLTGDSRRTLKLFPGVHKRPVGEQVKTEDEP